ncbi:hypothetical protein ACFLXB_05070 [Chloroflexota bacterium]
MDIKELASLLTEKVVSIITLKAVPTEAAEQTRGYYDEIHRIISEGNYPIEEYALWMTLAILDKREVVLKGPYIAMQVAIVYAQCAGVAVDDKGKPI